MRISFQNADTKQSIDRWKSTEKDTQIQRIGTGSGYAGYTIDAFGMNQDHEVYQDKGKTTEDIMQEAGMQNVGLTRDYMAVMANSMSDEEFAELQKDGYRVGDMKIESAVTIVDQIKASLIQAGVTVSGYTDTLDMETLTEITGSEGLAQEMQQAFTEKGVPLTEETAKAAMQALKEAQALTEPDGDTLSYMVANGKEPVIEELYMAQFSSRMDGSRQGRGYYQDENGYLSRRAEAADMDRLQPQIDRILTEAGLMDTAGADDAARWLIGAGIPLTKETLNNYMTLTKIQFPLEQSELLQEMAAAVADGRAPRQARLTDTFSLWEQAADIWNRWQQVSDEAVDYAAQQGKGLTLQKLEQAQKQLTDGYQNTAGKNITARRQLEEVRLQMTISANRELLKSGYAIETAELEELVEALKNVEKQQNEILFCGNSEQETAMRAQLYTETQSIASYIPDMPVAAVGKVGIFGSAETGKIPQAADFTLQEIQTEGEALAAAYKKAGEQYETFRTRPDAELGDSIRKAFQNVDALLEEAGMEITEANRRAVRILGYNHLEITEENILTIKAADQTLGNVIDKLTPSATLDMIRDGKNPLDMTVAELDDYLSGQEQEAESEQERFSRFLYKLEQKDEITEEEKESYIGIYRLLRQIEKTDGAVIGSLIHQGAELSFKNLLTAVRTYRAKPIDTTVDDELGTTQEIKQSGSRIDEQIAKAFVRKIYYGLDEAHIASAPDVNMSLEAFAEQLEKTEENTEKDIKDTESELSYRRQQIKELRDMQTVDAKQVEFLETLGEPLTLNNLRAAEEFRQNLSKSFMKIRKEADKYNNSRKNEFQTAASILEEQFNSREEAAAAYQAFTETEKQLLENAMYENDEVTSLDVKELGLIYKQVSFTAKLADTEHYEIPLITENSVTALHLQVIHSQEHRGMVEASMELDGCGRVSVRLQLQAGELKGLFVDIQKENRDISAQLKEQLETALEQNGFGKNVKSEKTDTASWQEEAAQAEATPTGELYRAAKTVIHVMRRQAERG